MSATAPLIPWSKPGRYGWTKKPHCYTRCTECGKVVITRRPRRPGPCRQCRRRKRDALAAA